MRNVSEKKGTNSVVFLSEAFRRCGGRRGGGIMDDILYGHINLLLTVLFFKQVK
jgi:hypothetical protein